MDYAYKQYYIALRGIAEEDEGEAAADAAKELRESFEDAQKRAETGDAEAQLDLGMHYYYGFGTEEDEEQAFKWYEKAALQGNSDAMHNLAWNYGQARGVDRDMDKFYEWEKKAAFAYYAESKTAATAETAKDKIASAVHAVLCYADGAPDKEVIALFNEMRSNPQVQKYVAKRYSADPNFLDDLGKRLGA